MGLGSCLTHVSTERMLTKQQEETNPAVVPCFPLLPTPAPGPVLPVLLFGKCCLKQNPAAAAPWGQRLRRRSSDQAPGRVSHWQDSESRVIKWSLPRLWGHPQTATNLHSVAILSFLKICHTREVEQALLSGGRGVGLGRNPFSVLRLVKS